MSNLYLIQLEEIENNMRRKKNIKATIGVASIVMISIGIGILFLSIV